MINQGQNVGYGTGNAYAFGSYVNPNAPQVQAPAQPVVDPVAAPQAIPGINEYYQSISNLKAMTAQAKEMGIDITKPDYSDPERMAAYNLFLQAQGKVAALGNKLAKGATLEAELGKRIAKGETVVGQNFNFNVPLNEQYVMQNTRFAGMPQEVTNINNGLGKQAQTVSAYRAAMKDYSSARTMLQNRADAAKKAGQFQEAAKYEDQINMLVRPRLENVQERELGLRQRMFDSASQSVKLKEDKLVAEKNSVNFALNNLERPFQVDANGNIAKDRNGRPILTQAVKDVTGMVVGAPFPSIPNSEVLGANVIIDPKTGRPMMQFRVAQYEQQSNSVKIGNEKDGYAETTSTKGRKKLGPDVFRTRYLDGETLSSVQEQLLDMYNYKRKQRGEEQIGQDAMATQGSLNLAGRRNESYLSDPNAILDLATRSNKPIEYFRDDIEKMVASTPAYQEVQNQYLNAKTEEEAQLAFRTMQAMKSLSMTDMQNAYGGQGPKITGYNQRVTKGTTTNLPGVTLPR
jgi:hypothetical protein